MKIYLKYKNTAAVWSSSQEFDALKVLPLVSVLRAKSTTLRSVEHSYLLDSKTNYEITISADELIDTAKKTFIENFFRGTGWKYSEDNFTTETEMTLDDEGEMPIEYIKNNKLLPEITLKLIQKYPD